MPAFRLLHIPPLFIATALTFGGMMPFWNPQGAIREFGLPERIQISPEAQACFTVYASRATYTGLAMWTFYLRGQYKVVDTLLALIFYAGAVDSWVCWREGANGSAVFRSVATLLVGGWGALGMTSRLA